MFGSIFEIQTDTFDFVHVERQIKRKELTMLWNMQALTFLRRPSQCAHNLKYLTCSCSILHTVSCYTASSVFHGMLCISDSYSGAQCCAWKPLGERKVAPDFPSSKTGTDPPFFGGRVYPSPDRHWQYIFTSNNCFSPSKKNLEKERRNICDTKEQLFLVW